MNERAAAPVVGIVTPVYNEADNLAAYAEEVTKVLLDSDEIAAFVLFVDDGSSDGSWKIVEDICTRDDRFRGIRLSRNFGSHLALSAGFANIEADAVVTLAADLQDPPETVLEFVREWRHGARIVWGARRSRQDSRWRMLTSRLFHWLLRRYAMPKGSQFTTGSFFLIDRKVLEATRQFGEAHRITFAIVAWTGFDQTSVLYDRRRRVAGVSGWDFRGMIRAMFDAFIGFSTLPISVMRLAAVSSFLVASALVVYLLIVGLAGSPIPGWSSQMLLLAGFFGVQFWLMAVVGEYLARIYGEVLRRPLYFISETAGEQPATGDDSASGPAGTPPP